MLCRGQEARSEHAELPRGYSCTTWRVLASWRYSPRARAANSDQVKLDARANPASPMRTLRSGSPENRRTAAARAAAVVAGSVTGTLMPASSGTAHEAPWSWSAPSGRRLTTKRRSRVLSCNHSDHLIIARARAKVAGCMWEVHLACVAVQQDKTDSHERGYGMTWRFCAGTRGFSRLRPGTMPWWQVLLTANPCSGGDSLS